MRELPRSDWRSGQNNETGDAVFLVTDRPCLLSLSLYLSLSLSLSLSQPCLLVNYLPAAAAAAATTTTTTTTTRCVMCVVV